MIRLTTLGRVRCSRDGQDLKDLSRQRKRFALLLYLATEQEATRESAYNILWAERDDLRARGALNQTVFELRQQLGVDCIESRGDLLCISESVRVDANEFIEAAQRSDCARSLELYRGDFLTAFAMPCKRFEFWVDRRRSVLSAIHRKLQRQMIAERIAAGDLNTAIELTRRWIDLAPGEDEAHHKLIELLAGIGERAGALQHFASYVRQLREEQIEPLDETRLMVERIRAGQFASLTRGSPTRLANPSARSQLAEPAARFNVWMGEPAHGRRTG